MKRTILVLSCLHTMGFSQNLVPNPGFEEVDESNLPTSCGFYVFQDKMKDWFVPTSTSHPSLITKEHLKGYITPPPPRSGDYAVSLSCMMHKVIDRKRTRYEETVDYIGIHLVHELSPYRTYKAEFWIRRADCRNPKKDRDEHMNNQFGMLFTPDSIATTDPVIYQSPQVWSDSHVLVTNKEWIRITGYFTPQQPCRYMYLGQFKKSEKDTTRMMTSHYVIDDISVVELGDLSLLDKATPLPAGSRIPLSHVHFITGTTELQGPESRQAIRQLTQYLQAQPSLKVRINGHTDAVGKKISNQLLSERRAETIAQDLIQLGISKDRLQWKGFGETNPVADNTSEQGRSLNRRVEFEIVR